LAFHKRKAAPQIQDEGFKLAEDGGFQSCLVVALAQAQEGEEVRVFEDLGGAGAQGFGRLSPNGAVRKLASSLRSKTLH
jgi:hypothetical protein